RRGVEPPRRKGRKGERGKGGRAEACLVVAFALRQPSAGRPRLLLVSFALFASLRFKLREAGVRYWALSVLTNSHLPPLTTLPLIAVSEVSPFWSKLQVPRMPLKLVVAKTAARIASRSFVPARTIASSATLAAS